MIDAILSGFALGLVLAMLIGPVFFLLLDTSIKRGFNVAVWLAVGVMLSDAFYIIITYFSSSAISFLKMYSSEIGVGGGVLLIVFGVLNFLKKPHISATALDLPDDSNSRMVDLVKGFTMNLLNPFVLLFWLGVAGGLSAREVWTVSQTSLFYSSVLITVLATDLLKAWLAVRLKRILRPGLLLWLNKISGAGLILFGLRTIYLVVFGGEL